MSANSPQDVTLGTDLGVAGASADGIYAAMDWLERRQDAIEKQLAARHLAPEPNPARMALSGLSWSAYQSFMALLFTSARPSAWRRPGVMPP